MIKKLIIAIGVFGVFVIYSLGIRHQSPLISTPSSIANGGTPSATTQTISSGQYKDGTYTGSSADAYYGNIQVSATISGGKLTDVQFLDYPQTHNTSVVINQQAMPYLKQEAIKTQSSNVQIISGATFTSQAFTQSLSSALFQAKA